MGIVLALLLSSRQKEMESANRPEYENVHAEAWDSLVRIFRSAGAVPAHTLRVQEAPNSRGLNGQL